MKISPEIAGTIWDILVKDAGAHEQDRPHFMNFALDSHNLMSPEYRFIGHLSFGDKIYLHKYGWTVGYYAENQTKKRDQIVDQINIKLAKLYERQRVQNQMAN